jgi:hypothetical protein
MRDKHDKHDKHDGLARLTATAVLVASALVACSAAPSIAPSGTQAAPTNPPTTAPSAPGSVATIPPAATTPAGPSAVASPPNATPGGRPALVADSFALTVTEGLRMRTEPRVSADSVKLEPLLWDGAFVFVIAGPVRASGYDWFLIHPLGEVDLATHPDPPALGWVAGADKDGEPWLASTPAPCDGGMPLDSLSDFDYPPIGLIGLACLGSRSATFDARLVSGFEECDPSVGLVPAWLEPCAVGLALQSRSAVSEEPLRLFVAFDPSLDLGGLPGRARSDPRGVAVHVTGQFDHPAARTCRSERDTAPELVVLGCRAQFVVTSISAG